MGKTIRFTVKGTNESIEMFLGSLGHHIYELTTSVKEMNDAIRWCNKHKTGDKFDCDKYSIEIIKDK